LSVEHFIRAIDDLDHLAETSSRFTRHRAQKQSGDALRLPISDDVDEIFHHMAGMVNACHKTLIFTNSRNDAEEIIHNLRRVAGVERDDEDSYFVHHGNISAALRERAEQ
jgi:Lhr-like helicase